jgi:hypothetical protein
MISRAIDTWSAWPVWAKWTSGIGAVVLIEAVSVASQERNFLAGLIEHAAALVLRYGTLALAVGGGIWIGMQIAKRSKTWIGVVGGIGTFLVLGVVGLQIVTGIPGVGWRITAMSSGDCYVDWDGRSNPTVCE